MRFYEMCKAALGRAAIWATLAVALLSTLLTWKVLKWWNWL